VHRHGTEVTILGPGPEDLEAMGANLMDVSRRPSVIETSLRTSAIALRDPDPLPVPHKKERSRPTLTRIYIPLNVARLRTLSTEGAVGEAPFAAHAVTDALRAAVPSAGLEEWEYDALNDAAHASAALLSAGETRRIVAAADVSSDLVGQVAPSDDAFESAVTISDSVDLRRIASFHVDGDSTQDDDLLWYDVTELPVVLDLVGRVTR
jgi:hypothetical protein